MSIVNTGILRYFYEDAQTDIEYKSSEFWQHYLKQEFADTRTYAVTCEVSPDGSRRRVDMVVKRYDANHHTMSALLWVECKRPGGSLREVEEQALDAAKRCVEADNLAFIYTMTTVGVSFRVWFYEEGRSGLVPFHGESTFADGSQYVDADSDNAWVLPRCLDMVKTETPLRNAPTLPSQSLADLQAAQEAQEDLGASQQPDVQSDYYTGEASSSSQPHKASLTPMDDPLAGNTQEVRVDVRREVHTFHPDKYIFKDIRGRTRVTVKKDWAQIKFDKKKVWVHYGKKTVYISDIDIT
ncbi:hypothetical protein F5B22DRAFT_55083 [Xylaria bambusicola]|uniref:uncharacterized protein n=1 Tax=Xylaria bambusicola TaxID=326684 RepID=UPI002008513B|nr:uncharacterized protein F5B22DRAFT_55083 [Xylaria bambusicola]KAI0520871.1 hypothetical protein F5B22DRAFT_55083 [Xylaria bambusicola]